MLGEGGDNDSCLTDDAEGAEWSASVGIFHPSPLRPRVSMRPRPRVSLGAKTPTMREVRVE